MTRPIDALDGVSYQGEEGMHIDLHALGKSDRYYRMLFLLDSSWRQLVLSEPVEEPNDD